MLKHFYRAMSFQGSNFKVLWENRDGETPSTEVTRRKKSGGIQGAVLKTTIYKKIALL